MILKFPYPYKSWFTVANDPDNTLIKDWNELDSFIWQKLALPISNSLFVKSYNHNLPDQVNLFDNPEITSQKHDIIHTWGDYMHSRTKGFDREDAIEACEILDKHGVNPKVWIDHSRFTGNVLHNGRSGSIPETKDQSGIVYKNFVYTLDLIKQVGISYVWSGSITDQVGQGIPFKRFDFFRSKSGSFVKAVIKLILFYIVPIGRFKAEFPDNRLYFPYEFPDGNKLYCFTRYGLWSHADIYGLGKVISPKNIDRLLKNEGAMITYTHLGKRPSSKLKEPFHIPEGTKLAFEYIKEKYDQKELMVSPISDLLDYSVLRDYIKCNASSNSIELVPDGIRYTTISQKDVSGKKFSFNDNEMDEKRLVVKSETTNLEFDLIKENVPHIFSIQFK